MARRAPAGLARLLGLAIALSLSACALRGPVAGTAGCGPPHFPYEGGWLGGDAAYSIPISAGRSVWLFGDSFVGQPRQPTRSGAVLVHNSIAISECGPDGDWKIEYRWSRAANGAHRAFLEPESSDFYWWLFDGFVYRDRLYIGLLEVESGEPRGPLKLPFHYRGVKLARVENPRDDPTDWRVDVLPLSEDTRTIPAGAMVTHGDHLYLFTFLDLDATSHPRMLSRIPLTALEASPQQLATGLEYLARDGRWKPGLEAANGLLVMDDDATEMTVRFHPEIGRWLAVYSDPIDEDPSIAPAASGAVAMRTAQRLEGPWSAPKSIYRFPELDEDREAGPDPKPFCYAAKEHPEYAREGRLLLTYVCNLFAADGEDPLSVLKRLERKMDLYRPRAVSIPIPALELR